MNRKQLQFVRFVVLAVVVMIFSAPLLWMVATAFKPIDQTMAMPPVWLPHVWLTNVDGEQLSVNIADDALDAEADQSVVVQAAYRWVMAVDGLQVPVRRFAAAEGAADTAEVTVTARYAWQVLHEGQLWPARVSSEIDELQPNDNVTVMLDHGDGMMLGSTVRRDELSRVYDTEALRKAPSYLVSETRKVSPETLSKQYIPWPQRTENEFVEIDSLTVARSDLTKRVAPQWNNFPNAIDQMGHFNTFVINTLIVCILAVIGTVCSSALVAYGFARIDWPGRDKVFILVLATMMIPFPVVMVPLYGLFRSLGWVGTLKPLWVPYLFATAFNVFLLRQFFRTIPRELSEAARIDGCSEFRIFLQIILPLARPALIVVALFQFMYSWNDFLAPLIYLTDESDYTLALGLQAMQNQQGGTEYHYLMAASVLVVLPVVLLFLIAQRAFVEGVSMSGLKG